ncbi:MAG TPA: hypothetical protein VEK82_08235 [Stellaceae bacterium]|nr:hypothetical protein [Stellaceae bacterium]
MTLNPDEIKTLRTACDRLPDGRDYRKRQVNDYIENLMLTVLDFQMRAEKTVNNAVAYFRERHHRIKTHQALAALLNQFEDSEAGNRALAVSLWNNNHWTRAKFLRVIVNGFQRHGITDQRSLVRWLKSAHFESDVRGKFRADRHGIGYVIFQWLRLRCGFDTVKPDRRILAFVENVIGRKVRPEECISALTNIAEDLGRKAYLLDSAIWHFEGLALRKGELVLVRSSWDNQIAFAHVKMISPQSVTVYYPKEWGWGPEWDERVPLSAVLCDGGSSTRTSREYLTR